MRKFLILLPLLVVPASAWAQQVTTPQVSIFGGYSNMVANTNNINFDLNGVNLSVQENMNSWFGGVLDFSTFFGTENGAKTNTQTLSYGPVFTYRKVKGVAPFGHVMVGAERGGSSYLNISQPETRLAVLAGGGLDVNITPRIAIRFVQVDYLMSKFSNARRTTSAFRVDSSSTLVRKNKRSRKARPLNLLPQANSVRREREGAAESALIKVPPVVMAEPNSYGDQC